MSLTIRIAIALLIAFTTGCAAIIAPSDEKTPDFRVIRKGAMRNAVEAELGKPVTDIRPQISTGASRMAEYHIVYREKISQDSTRGERIANKMTGLKKKVITIYYDRMGKVLKFYSEDK